MVTQIKKKGTFFLDSIKSLFLFLIVVAGILGLTTSKSDQNPSRLSLFDNVNRAHADTPVSSCGNNCDAGGCDGGTGGCGECGDSGDCSGGESSGICANCVGGCSYSDGTCGGYTDNSGTGVCGASANCEGGCGGSSSCASSGTGCGLY